MPKIEILILKVLINEMLVILITWEAQDHIWKEYQLGIVETTSPIWSRSAQHWKESITKLRQVSTHNRVKAENEEKRTENCSFPGIIEAKNKDPSFLIPEKRRKHSSKQNPHGVQRKMMGYR